MSTTNVSGSSPKYKLEDLKLDLQKPKSIEAKKTEKFEKLLNSLSPSDSTSTQKTLPDSFKQQVSFSGGKGKITPVATTQTTQVSSTEKPKNLNDRTTFTNRNLATPADIEKILKRYNSPHMGKGQIIYDKCKEAGVNPIMMLAIMQQESQFGSRNLNPENTANPFSVHFNHSAKGIAKLRLPSGQLPTFEQSLDGGIRTVKKLAGDSATPLTTAGKKYAADGGWAKSIQLHYTNLLKRY